MFSTWIKKKQFSDSLCEAMFALDGGRKKKSGASNASTASTYHKTTSQYKLGSRGAVTMCYTSAQMSPEYVVLVRLFFYHFNSGSSCGYLISTASISFPINHY